MAKAPSKTHHSHESRPTIVPSLGGMGSKLHNTLNPEPRSTPTGREQKACGSILLPRLAALFASVTLSSSTWACWGAAAERYGIAPELLYAVASVESNLNAAAVNKSHLQRTGSYDIGLMQINSTHVPALARYGITEAALYDPCTNIQVGAWLLAESFARHGVTWSAVGAYNASCSQLKGATCTNARARYAWQVYRRLPSVASSSSPPRTDFPTQPETSR